MKADLLPEMENERVALQVRLDDSRPQTDRNRLGQFATPTTLARQIVSHGIELLPADSKIRFLDPGMGTGAFYSALLHAVPSSRLECARGFEIDPYYGRPAMELWAKTALHLELADFTRIQPPAPSDRFNLIIANPPYVRHHHISKGEKDRLQVFAQAASGVRVQGLAGLYCYFMMLAHAWLASDGVAGWLIPSEFMNVNYGDVIKRYLLDKVTLLQIHRFDPTDVQFGDALVSSAIVWFRNGKPRENHRVEFTYGGTLGQPAVAKMVSIPELRDEPKWTRFPLLNARDNGHTVTLGDLFAIKRGVATGGNNFFILREHEINERHLPMVVFRPLLPSPRYLRDNEVTTDADGRPNVEPRLFLLDCDLPEEEIQLRYPNLARYLEGGKDNVARGYICRHRSPWYSQEERAPAPILCTYIGRTDTKNGRPFRFILNRSQATALNVYLLLYPRPALAAKMRSQPGLLVDIWQALGQIDISAILQEGRVYGGGMHKLEPRELARVPADSLLTVIPKLRESVGTQMELFTAPR